MTRLPTDRKILNAIYERYHPVFEAYSEEEAGRDSKIMVPIDISALARDMRIDRDIIFGRLYYHLEKKYGYRNEDGSYVRLFALQAGKDPHCVNFPLLASVLAALREQNRKHLTATGIALFSLGVSVTSLLISLLV